MEANNSAQKKRTSKTKAPPKKLEKKPQEEVEES